MALGFSFKFQSPNFFQLFTCFGNPRRFFSINIFFKSIIFPHFWRYLIRFMHQIIFKKKISKIFFFDGDSPKTWKVEKNLVTEIQRKNQGLLSDTIFMTIACHMRVQEACEHKKCWKKYERYTPPLNRPLWPKSTYICPISNLTYSKSTFFYLTKLP